MIDDLRGGTFSEKSSPRAPSKTCKKRVLR